MQPHGINISIISVSKSDSYSFMKTGMRNFLFAFFVVFVRIEIRNIRRRNITRLCVFSFFIQLNLCALISLVPLSSLRIFCIFVVSRIHEKLTRLKVFTNEDYSLLI